MDVEWDQQSGSLLVETDDVSRRVAEPRGDLGSVRADWLHDLASCGDDRVSGWTKEQIKEEIYFVPKERVATI